MSAYNPNDSNNTFASKTLQVCFQYANLTPTITFNGSNGNFSRYADGSIYIGDGETANFSVGFPKSDTNATVASITGSLQQGGNGVQVQGSASGSFSVSGGEDIMREVYKVTEAYRPVYVANPKTDTYLLDASETYEELPGDWKEDISLVFTGGDGHPWDAGNARYDNWAESRAGLHVNSKDINFLFTKNYKNTRSESVEDIYPSLFIINENNKIKKIRDKNLEREWEKDEFESITFWYLPDKEGPKYKDSHSPLNNGKTASVQLILHEGIVTENAKAVKQISESTSATLATVGTVVVSYNHNGKQKKYEVMLFYESRNCLMTYQTSTK